MPSNTLSGTAVARLPLVWLLQTYTIRISYTIIRVYTLGRRILHTFPIWRGWNTDRIGVFRFSRFVEMRKIVEVLWWTRFIVILYNPECCSFICYVQLENIISFLRGGAIYHGLSTQMKCVSNPLPVGPKECTDCAFKTRSNDDDLLAIFRLQI